jgi:hypothetical protein
MFGKENVISPPSVSFVGIALFCNQILIFFLFFFLVKTPGLLKSKFTLAVKELL